MSDPPTIDRQLVEQIAALAQLALTEEEITVMRAELTQILAYVATLNEVETTDVAATRRAIPLAQLWRDDQPRPGLATALGLQAAPEPLGDAFGVPRPID